MAVGTGNQGFPVVRRLHTGGRHAEVHMVIVGENEERSVAHIDIILPPRFTRGHHDGGRGRIIGRHQTHFAGDIVARANDNPILLRGQANADAKTNILFLIQQFRLGQFIAKSMIPGIVRTPIFIGEAVDHPLAIR